MSEEVFSSALDVNPKDWDVRRQYADWLDENQRPYEALAQRWMAKNRECPLWHEYLHPSRPPHRCWSWVGPVGSDMQKMEELRDTSWYPVGVIYSMLTRKQDKTVRRSMVGHAGEHLMDMVSVDRRAAERYLVNALRHIHENILGMPSLEAK